MLAHHRRAVVHSNVTACPTAAWTAHQLVEALPWESGNRRFLLRERDGIYGARFRRRVDEAGREEVLIAPRYPWQVPYAARLIGSIRRQCLDHTLVVGERRLKRVLAECFPCYHRWRTHQSLAMDSPEGREVQAVGRGGVVEYEEVGGPHHHYERAAA